MGVKEWLEVAGVDLDKPYDQQPSGFEPSMGLAGVGASKGKFPMPRLSGVRLKLEMSYYNYNLDKDATKDGPDVYCILEVSLWGGGVSTRDMQSPCPTEHRVPLNPRIPLTTCSISNTDMCVAYHK